MPAYISEVAYAGSRPADFVEIRVEAGTDMSGYSLLVYDSSGNITFTNTFGSPDATMSGSDVYVIDDTDAGGLDLRDNRAVALVDDNGIVVQFITFEGNSITGSEGPANGLTATIINSTNGSNDSSMQSDNGGASYYEQTTPNAGAVPCYAPGTLIDTPDGPRVIETLRPGNLVSTVDHGPQAIRWVRSGDHPLDGTQVEDKPVLIQAGALGAGRPVQDLIVSPQHRMLVGGGGQLDGWFKSEAFAPAKSLTALPGIRHMKGKRSITWVHFACDQHEVIFANGCLSESLLLGQMVVNGLTSQERRELTAIYGAAATPDAVLNGPAARDCQKVGEVRRHLATCKKDNERRIAKEIRKWDIDLAMEQREADQLGLTPSKSQKPDLMLVS